MNPEQVVGLMQRLAVFQQPAETSDDQVALQLVRIDVDSAHDPRDNRTMFFRTSRLAASAGFVISLVLAACGPSRQASEEALLQCSAYLSVLAFRGLGDEDSVMSQLERSPGASSSRILLLAQTGAAYVEQMDPARAASLAEAGQQAALEHHARQDVAAATAYLEDCSRHFDALAR